VYPAGQVYSTAGKVLASPELEQARTTVQLRIQLASKIGYNATDNFVH